MNDFDQAARYAAKLDPTGFINWLVPGLAFVFRGWLDTRTPPFPGERDRTCDTVAGLARNQRGGVTHVLVVEFQSEPDAEILERLLEYAVRVRRELPGSRQRREVGCAFVNLTGRRQRDTLRMALSDTPGIVVDFKVAVRTMPDEDAAETLAGIQAGPIARCILPWIPLMRGGGEADIIEEWMLVSSQEPDARRRGAYGGLALVFCELTAHRRSWRAALKGWNMLRSQIVEEWRQEGRVEGRVEEKRADVLRALQLRLANPVPADIAAPIEQQPDLEVLSRWFDLALTADSLETFRAGIRH